MRLLLLSCWLLAASGTVVLAACGTSRCNSAQSMSMPSTHDSCRDASSTLGLPFVLSTVGRQSEGPLCAVNNDNNGPRVEWNAAGTASSTWVGTWQAVCTCHDSSSCTSAVAGCSGTKAKGRGEINPMIMFMIIPLILLVIPLAYMKIKMKQRGAEMRRQAAGAQMQQPQAAVPAGSMMVGCPPGVKSGESIMVAMPDGQQVTVQVPPGVAEGGQFMVQAPVAPVAVQATVVGPAP